MVDLSAYDFESIVEQTDKLHEAEYFLNASRQQSERREFRWLVSAFLNAAYSYFDTAALTACHSSTNEDGDTEADPEAVKILEKYIKIDQKKSNPFRIHTQAVHPLVEALYMHRRDNTHYFPMSIMATGPHPENFELGSERGKGVPLIQLCGDIMTLMRQVQNELDNAWTI